MFVFCFLTKSRFHNERFSVNWNRSPVFNEYSPICLLLRGIFVYILENIWFCKNNPLFFFSCHYLPRKSFTILSAIVVGISFKIQGRYHIWSKVGGVCVVTWPSKKGKWMSNLEKKITTLLCYVSPTWNWCRNAGLSIFA